MIITVQDHTQISEVIEKNIIEAIKVDLRDPSGIEMRITEIMTTAVTTVTMVTTVIEETEGTMDVNTVNINF
jgi:hypothetical protein